MPTLTTVLTGLPVMPTHSPERTRRGEGVDLLEDLVHVGDGVLAVDRQGVGRGATQRGVQDGAVLGDVDVLARKHAVAQLEDAGLLGEGEEVAHQRGAHEILRQVDMQVGSSVSHAGVIVGSITGISLMGSPDSRDRFAL